MLLGVFLYFISQTSTIISVISTMGFMDLFHYLYESRLSDLFTDLRYKLLISSTPGSTVKETGVTNWYQSGVVSRS